MIVRRTKLREKLSHDLNVRLQRLKRSLEDFRGVVAESIVGIDDRDGLHIRLLRKKVDRIGDEFRNGVAVGAEHVLALAIHQQLMRIAIPADSRNLKLLRERCQCQAVCAGQGCHHHLVLWIAGQTPILRDDALSSLRLVNIDRIHLNTTDATLGIDLLDHQVSGVLARHAIRCGWSGRECENANSERAWLFLRGDRTGGCESNGERDHRHTGFKLHDVPLLCKFVCYPMRQ